MLNWLKDTSYTGEDMNERVKVMLEKVKVI